MKIDMNKDILLVEDNPDDIELTLDAFNKLNIGERVEVFHDGAEILEYLLSADVSEDSPRYAIKLILLDLNLPKVNGLQVLERLRSDPRTHAIPTVMLTSSSLDRDRMESYKNGVNSYITKPIDFDEFIDLAKQLTLYWTEINEAPVGDINISHQ